MLKRNPQKWFYCLRREDELKQYRSSMNTNTYSPLFCWVMTAVCKSAVKDRSVMAHFLIPGTKSSDVFILGLVRVAFETLKWKGGYIHTGSFPSIASIHRRLLASDRACRVMTPCLRERERERGHHPADLISAASLCLSAIVPVSPLNHLNVKTEAFVDGIPLSSDTRAQPEHLGWDVHHAVLSSGRETVPCSWFLCRKSTFHAWISSKKKVSKRFSPD